MGEIVPVLTLDGRAIGGPDRPVTRRLCELFRALVDAEAESPDTW
jgi:branched-subunit amino acid aminotransferase/4-amino-4-deoxychorismate lyase